MKRRIFTAVLAAALVLSLAACGGKPGGTSSSNPGGSSNGVSSSQPDASNPDASNPDASAPDGSTPDGSQPDASTPDTSNPDGSQPDASNPGSSSSQGASISLNKTDATLKKAGATFQLRYTAQPDGVEVFFSSSDEKVATVDGKGTVTAVGPGTATITATLGSELAEATCIVRCRWEESSNGGSSSSGSSSSGGSSSAPASKVDLQSFYDTTVGKYEFSFMMEADSATLDNFFAGLSDLSLSQQVIYLCGMSPSPHGDFALVQVNDSKDVDTVKGILQARIDYMVGDGNGPGGAFYPMEQTMWEENARIASNGNYVMLIVHPNCDDIVKEFNALF